MAPPSAFNDPQHQVSVFSGIRFQAHYLINHQFPLFEKSGLEFRQIHKEYSPTKSCLGLFKAALHSSAI